MDNKLKTELLNCGTDIDGAMYRFANNGELYIACLQDFLKDSTIKDLENAINAEMWDEAFTAVHAIKGAAGNMGFVPLFFAAAESVIVIRKGKTKEVKESFDKLKKCYLEIVDVIKKNCN